MQLNYFAFGSNLSSARLLRRLPRARVACVAILDRHELCWRKNGRDNSGKCDLAFTDKPEDLVYGVVYQMTAAEQQTLDRIESAGYGYQRRDVSVITLTGDILEAFTYFALDIDHRKQPYRWYKEHVLRGALEHEFPADYIEGIRATPSIDDQDAARHARELSIYLEE